MTDESPYSFGPFIIMEYIQHTFDLVDALNKPGLTLDDRPILDPQISSERLELIYSQMADNLLELSRHSFPRIGSLAEADDGSWPVTGRPVTVNMNELIQLGNFPRSKLPPHPILLPLTTSRHSQICTLRICRPSTTTPSNRLQTAVVNTLRGSCSEISPHNPG